MQKQQETNAPTDNLIAKHQAAIRLLHSGSSLPFNTGFIVANKPACVKKKTMDSLGESQSV